jgi:hypothetical protein
MTAIWAIWDLVSANALADFESESEALSFVRELIGKDWKADELVLIYDDPMVADEDLPLGVTGEDLARRATASFNDPDHRIRAIGRDVTEEGYRLFYRIVQTNPPTLIDFTSNLALGRKVPDDPEIAALWDGLSVQSTLAQARRRRTTSPMLGSYIATIRVPTDGSVRYARTLSADGHHTIWGDPALLLAMVLSVLPV